VFGYGHFYVILWLKKNVMTITIQINDLAELEPIHQWLQGHSIKLEHNISLPLVGQPRSKLLTPDQERYSEQVVGNGAEATCFGDASEWQRQQRQDRELPFTL
jgi:hypothetical protein